MKKKLETVLDIVQAFEDIGNSNPEIHKVGYIYYSGTFEMEILFAVYGRASKAMIGMGKKVRDIRNQYPDWQIGISYANRSKHNINWGDYEFRPQEGVA